MLDKIRSFFFHERKESRAYRALLGMGLNDIAVWTPRDYESLTRRAYTLNSDVFACINLISNAAKQIPWIVRSREEGAEVAEKHPLWQLLKKPNERDTGSDFTESCITFLLLNGNCYVERSGGTEGTPPAFLYSHRPDRMRVRKGGRRLMVAGYEYKASGAPVLFEEWEIMHLRLFNPLDDFYGMSPLEAALFTIDCGNESRALYKKLLQRGYPPGAISVEGEDWTDTQIARFKTGLTRATEQNQVLYLGNAKWQSMGFKPVDASIFESRKYDKRDIAAIFRVPPEMIGDSTSKTYSNYQEARRSLYTEAVLPILTHLRDGLNNWLAPTYGNAFIDFDKDGIDALSEDREVAANRVSLLWTTDVIRRNEARAELKYDAVPDEEDVYYSEIAAAHAAAAAEAAAEAIAADPIPGDMPDEGEEEEDEDNLQSGRDRRKPRLEAAGLKILNLISEEEKETHWKLFERDRERWYQRIAIDAEDRFIDERNAVLKAYRDAGESNSAKETAALRAVTRQEDEWSKLYRSTYLLVSEEFGRRVLNSIKSNGYEHEVKFEMDLFTRTVLAWLAKEGAQRVTFVLDTTKEKIRRELSAGVLAGEGTFELSRRLESMYTQFSLVRAERIARTEVHTASELGSHTAARSTNLPLFKEWLATPDNRTRDPHAAAHGQRKGMDEPYIVMGQRLMFPGDGTLGATGDNTIQCRCSSIFNLKRG